MSKEIEKINKMSKEVEEVKILKSQWEKLRKHVDGGVCSNFVDSDRGAIEDDLTGILRKFPKSARKYLLDTNPKEWTSEESRKFLQDLGASLWEYIRPNSENIDENRE